jgi:hypothetical protein
LHLGCSPLSLSSPSSLFFFRWWRWLWRPRFLTTVINTNDRISQSNGQP